MAVEGKEAVAALGASAVARVAGALQQAQRGRSVDARPRDADGAGDGDGLARGAGEGEAHRREATLRRGGERGGVAHRSQHDGEAALADARHQVHRSHRGGDGHRRLDQKLGRRRPASFLEHRLELVNIDHQHRDAHAGARGGLDRLAGTVVQHLGRGEPRQRIAPAALLEQMGQGVDLGAVVQHHANHRGAGNLRMDQRLAPAAEPARCIDEIDRRKRVAAPRGRSSGT